MHPTSPNNYNQWLKIGLTKIPPKILAWFQVKKVQKNWKLRIHTKKQDRHGVNKETHQ
jgi:hypothetical protein